MIHGLCPIEKDGIPCTLTMGGTALVAGAASGATYGAIGGTFVLPGGGTVTGAVAGGAVGGTAGLLAGAVVGAARDLTSLVSAALNFADKLRPKDGSEQRDEIEKAQEQHRKHGQGDRIERTNKSRQRGKVSDRQKAQDELDGIRED